MFLIMSLVVVCVAYWISALLAECLFDSNAEKSLSCAIRTGFGFYFSVTYFAAAWQLVSIQNAWIIGFVLMLIFLYGKHGSEFPNVIGKRLRANFGEHLRHFLLIVLGANIFFAPLMISSKFGPFTEGGGDVSIYADLSSYLTTRQLTVYGNPGNLKNAIDNIRDLTHIISYDRHKLNELADNRYRNVDPVSINHPTAEAPLNRLLTLQTMGAYLYAPYGQYYFLSGATNYHIYYGVLAFLYATLLVSSWIFFRQFGSISASLAVVLVLCSHGLISVFYNMYSAQALSIVFSILILNALPHLSFRSIAGFRSYGVGTLYIASTYIHFLAVIFPVMLIALVTKYFQVPIEQKIVTSAVRSRSIYQRSSSFIGVSVFGALMILLLFGGSKVSFLLITDIIASTFSGEKNSFMGDSIQPLSWKWLSFLFGILSQQHYLPFAKELVLLNGTVILGTFTGVLAFVVGGIIMVKACKSDKSNTRHKGCVALYLVLLATVFLHILFTQTSLYTQAKGAQNTLVFVYVAMLMPLVMGSLVGAGNVDISKKTRLLQALLVAFCITLLIPRLAFGIRLSLSKDRAGILEPSYFIEAEKIRQIDPTPFVLFEPRKSADLYLGNQPFFGGNVIPTRHLVLQQLNMDTRPVSARIVLGSDLLRLNDIPNIWLLRVKKLHGVDTWISERLVDKETVEPLFFGSDYERNFGERDIGFGATTRATFSYMRNGAILLFLPSGSKGRLQVTLEPRSIQDYEALVKEVTQQLKLGELTAKMEMKKDEKRVQLTADVPAQTSPSLMPIPRFSGEFWVNLTFNGKDL